MSETPRIGQCVFYRNKGGEEKHALVCWVHPNESINVVVIEDKATTDYGHSPGYRTSVYHQSKAAPTKLYRFPWEEEKDAEELKEESAKRKDFPEAEGTVIASVGGQTGETGGQDEEAGSEP